MNILITGGTSGLGRASIELLAKEKKNKVWYTYKDVTKAELIDTKYDNVFGLYADFRNVASIDKLCEDLQILDLEVLVNNAYSGIPQSNHFYKTDPSEFLTAFEDNIIPTIKITKTAIKIFKKKRFGKIINILSEALVGLPPIGYAIYTANKAYIQQLSKVWNKEYSKFNISSNCISPAYMQTNFANVDERIVEHMTSEHPLKKLLTTQEVAETILFLINCSQQVNGVNLTINAAQNIA